MKRTAEYRVSWETLPTYHPQSRIYQGRFYADRLVRRLAKNPNAIDVRLDVRQVGPWQEVDE
jgi:hypothetical protein